MRPIRDTDALIVVDVQYDFLPGGSLGVDDGDRVIPIVNRLVPHFVNVVFTRDWHPPDHVSFADPPEYRDGSWPPHCVRHTHGAEFHRDMLIPDGALVVSKATRPDREEYSSFQATEADLVGWLRARGVEHVYVAGIATDYCVRATSLDALTAGFSVTVLVDAVRGVAPETTSAALREMADAGVELIESTELTGPPAGDGGPSDEPGQGRGPDRGAASS